MMCDSDHIFVNNFYSNDQITIEFFITFVSISDKFPTKFWDPCGGGRKFGEE